MIEVFTNKFQLFSLLFARVLAAFSLAPFYGAQNFSTFYRIGLSFLISLIITPLFPSSDSINLAISESYFTVLLQQVFIGALLGVCLLFVFAAFQTAGEFFSVQMGFGINQVLDPLSQISLPLMGTLKNTIALYVFFVSSSHLYFIDSIVYSYVKIPILQSKTWTIIIEESRVIEFLIFLLSSLFLIALKLAMPVLGALLLVSLTLGILSKAAPQMNILLLGFPLKIYLAFLVLTLVSGYTVEFMHAQFDSMFQHIQGFIDQNTNL